MSDDFTPGVSGQTAGHLEIRNLCKTYYSRNGAVEALRDISLEAPAGKFISIVGPSGCGKSTLFSILAGLEDASSGTVLINGEETGNLLGRSSYMPQDDALLPWLRIVDNVALGIPDRKLPKKERRKAALAVLDRAGLAGFARSYPHELSGGMRQRAAFLRTLMSRRPVILLDEPFGALDSVTRETMQTWLLEQWQDTQATVIMVTHDVTEAVYLSDTVYVLTARPGRLSAVLDIRLKRPRPASIKETEEFARYETALRRELRIAMEKGAVAENSPQ